VFFFFGWVGVWLCFWGGGGGGGGGGGRTGVGEHEQEIFLVSKSRSTGSGSGSGAYPTSYSARSDVKRPVDRVDRLNVMLKLGMSGGVPLFLLYPFVS